MATDPPATVPRRRRPIRLRIVLIVVAGAVLLLAWFWKPLNLYAVTGASVAARTACSCHYVSGRSLGDCRDDFEPGMSLIALSSDAEERSVTARFPLLASQTARFHVGEGCVLEPWRH